MAHLIELAFSPVEIADRLGHESMSVTMTYSHLYPSKQRKMADRLNQDHERMEEQWMSKFKEKLPEDSKKYMKTIVAFSNGDGGRLIIGVNDDREVVGVEQTAVFSMIDKITNAISDSCEPLIIPDIAPQAVGDKTVIVVEISAVRQRPYYQCCC